MKQPNVIVFFTDQQRWDTTGAGGNPCGLTPNFDRMAQEGTWAKYAFTPQPVCGPARAALQTGKYAAAIHMHHNGLVLPKEHKTMAHYFNEAGYDTAYIGKWHLGDTRGAVPEDQRGEFRYWLGAGSLEHTSRPYDTVVYDHNDTPVKLPGYRVDALTDAAVRYIGKKHENPFFLFLSFLEPHFQNSNDSFPGPDSASPVTNPYIPPDLGALTGTSRQHLPGYYGMVKRLDECLGRIQDVLKSLHLTENTIVLFTTDHGCHFKTRNAEYKRSCHDSSIRIPMAFTGGPFSGGGCLQQLVSLIDVAPTLLDACGIPVPGDMQGRSILPLVNRTACDWPDDVFAQISESQTGRTVRTHRWKYAVEAPGTDPIQDSGAGLYVETALYDLENDPYELDNLIGMAPLRPVADRMKKRLLRRMREAGEPLPEIQDAPEQPARQHVLFDGEENL